MIEQSIDEMLSQLNEIPTEFIDGAPNMANEIFEGILQNPTFLYQIDKASQDYKNSGKSPEMINTEISHVKDQVVKKFAELITEADDDNRKKLLSDFCEAIVKVYADLLSTEWYDAHIHVQKCRPSAMLPTRAHWYDVGFDVAAAEEVTVYPGQTIIVPTGLKMSIPPRWVVSVRPRSGLSAKTDLRLANAPGTIDPGYLDEVGVIITNIGDERYTIHSGDRIAQLVVEKRYNVEFIECDDVTKHSDINRMNDSGVSGYGSTGN